MRSPTHPALTVRVDWWKPSSLPGKITPCDEGDEEANECRVEVFGEFRAEHISFREGRDMDTWVREIKSIERLLIRAFEQGRSRQARFIKEALNI